MNKRFYGIGMSYLLIVVNFIVGMFFIPIILRTLGDEEYGMYKLIASTAAYLSILDLGVGSTITRYVLKFKTEHDETAQTNFLAIGMMLYGILAVLVLVAAGCLSVVLPGIYAKSIPAEDMPRAQLLLMIIAAQTAFSMFNHAFNGLFVAYERFIYIKGINIVQIFVRFALIFAGIRLYKSALVIALVDLFLVIVIIVMNIFYTKFSLRCRIRMIKWDGPLVKETAVFTSAILLQTIINQFNSNVDSIVLGIYTTTGIVAMYSLVIQLYHIYGSLSTAISSIYQPKVSNMVFRGESDRKVTESLVEPSRFQLFILLLTLSGFALFGNNFIALWVGDKYSAIYPITLILLTSSTLELSQNTITNVLKAKNLLHGQTFILAGSTAVNFILTLLLVPRFGAIGAAAGTAFSMIFGYGIGLNLYYHFKAGIQMRYYYKKVLERLLPAVLIPAVFGVVINYFITVSGWVGFLIRGCLYVVIYGLSIYFIGFNGNEKGLVKKAFNKLSGKKLHR